MSTAAVERRQVWPAQALEAVTCPLCGPGPGTETRFDFAPFQVVACRNCTLMFLSPRLTEREIMELYQTPEYFQSSVAGRGYDEYLEVRANWHKTFARRLAEIRPHQPGGRVLDVGCGPGFFMEVAAARGYDVWGVDPSAYVVRLAREQFGDRVRQGTLADLVGGPERFDLIVAFDTFEHIYQPLEFLDMARGLLNPQGVLAITTPDPTSLLARLSGRRWVSFKLPEHVFYWSPTAMRQALRGRFDVLGLAPAGQYATASFIVRRLFGLGPPGSGPLGRLLNTLSRLNLYSDNGSLTVIARRTDG